MDFQKITVICKYSTLINVKYRACGYINSCILVFLQTEQACKYDCFVFCMVANPFTDGMAEDTDSECRW